MARFPEPNSLKTLLRCCSSELSLTERFVEATGEGSPQTLLTPVDGPTQQ